MIHTAPISSHYQVDFLVCHDEEACILTWWGNQRNPITIKGLHIRTISCAWTLLGVPIGKQKCLYNYQGVRSDYTTNYFRACESN